MAERRIVVIEACRHGEYEPEHLIEGGDPESSIAYCRDDPPRRVLSEGEYVLVEKVDGEWPEWALTAADPFKTFLAADGYTGLHAETPQDILDALAQEHP